jgi:hypothetical protein
VDELFDMVDRGLLGRSVVWLRGHRPKTLFSQVQAAIVSNPRIITSPLHLRLRLMHVVPAILACSITSYCELIDKGFLAWHQELQVACYLHAL